MNKLTVEYFKYIAIIIVVLGSLSGCSTYNWHQKLTVTVETPNGPKSASSVVNVLVENHNAFYELPESRGGTWNMSGEAVVLEVAPRRYLFALMKRMPRADQVFFPGEDPMDITAKLTAKLPTATLTPKQYPVLVTFADLEDPKSVRLVDPEHLDTVFGTGYLLSSMTLAITDEPLTKGKVEPVLFWLCDYKKKRVRLSGEGGSIGDTNLANNLGGSNFIDGDCK